MATVKKIVVPTTPAKLNALRSARDREVTNAVKLRDSSVTDLASEFEKIGLFGYPSVSKSTPVKNSPNLTVSTTNPTVSTTNPTVSTTNPTVSTTNPTPPPAPISTIITPPPSFDTSHPSQSYQQIEKGPYPPEYTTSNLAPNIEPYLPYPILPPSEPSQIKEDEKEQDIILVKNKSSFFGKMKNLITKKTGLDDKILESISSGNYILAIPSNLIQNFSIALPENNTLVASPENNTSDTTTENNTPVASPENNTPVASPKNNTPVASPKNTTPVVLEKRRITRPIRGIRPVKTTRATKQSLIFNKK